jgi:putative hydrolase of the HAD superfamily
VARLEAVTFDLGGTLVEYENVPWEELEGRGWRGLHARLVARGRSARTVDEFAGAMAAATQHLWERAIATQESAGLRDAFAHGSATLGLTPSDDDDFEDLAEHFYAATVELVSVYEDSRETLAELKRRGVKLALISNTLWPGALHTRDLARFGLEEFFDVLTYSSATPFTKPHASIFLETLRQLGVRPEAAAHVGDRIVDDVQGAQRAGLKGILKAHPRRVPETRIVPDVSIRTLSELPAALDRLFA